MNMYSRFEEDRPMPAPQVPAPLHAHDHDQIFVPRPILYMMIALALFTIVAIGVARATGSGLTREHGIAAATRVDFRTGAVQEGPIVATLADGRQVTLAGSHEDIFPRMILQGITTIRHNVNAAADAPLTLQVGRDGQRLIVDTATGHIIRLSAFGPDNGHSFDALLAGVRA